MMTRRPNKKKRLRTYVWMNKLYGGKQARAITSDRQLASSMENHVRAWGLCHLLKDFDPACVTRSQMKENYPELYAQKPSHCWNGVWWWIYGSRKPRERATRRAILMLDPKHKF